MFTSSASLDSQTKPKQNFRPSLSFLSKKKAKPSWASCRSADVIYKTVVVKLPVLVPGGIVRAAAGVANLLLLAVLRADAKQPRCKGKACVLYLHGNGTASGARRRRPRRWRASWLRRRWFPSRRRYGLAEGAARRTPWTPATHISTLPTASRRAATGRRPRWRRPPAARRGAARGPRLL